MEAYELTTQGGSRLCTADRCVRVVRTLLSDRWFGRHCYVEPVYTLDADLVVIAGSLPALTAHLEAHGFRTDVQKHSVNAQAPGSELRIQFTGLFVKGTDHLGFLQTRDGAPGQRD